MSDERQPFAPKGKRLEAFPGMETGGSVYWEGHRPSPPCITTHDGLEEPAMKHDRHTASDAEVQAITTLVLGTRPSWDEWQVRAVLSAHRGQVDAPDLAVAAVRCANDPNQISPKCIGWRGPHWRGLGTMPAQHRERLERCHECGKPEDRCLTERPGPDDHDFVPVPRRPA